MLFILLFLLINLENNLPNGKLNSNYKSWKKLEIEIIKR